MPLDDKAGAPVSASRSAGAHVEPPKIYIPACGALCDIFWWARGNPTADKQDPLPVSDNRGRKP
jgi:hypothetical protein